ncbi:MAG: EamA family transporter [Ferrimicrobium sp.]
MGAFLAVCSSIAWGSADFGGGMFSRRLAPLASVFYSQGIAMFVVVTLTLVSGDYHANIHLLWAVGAGIVGPFALVAYYKALAIGPMGVVGPVSATAGAIPVAVGMIFGEQISTLQLVGLAGCIVGVVVVSTQHFVGLSRVNLTAVGLAGVSAAGFGVVFVCLAKSSLYGVLATLAVQRMTNVAVLLVVLAVARPAIKVGVRTGMLLGVVGIVDVTANALFTISIHFGQLAIVGALGSIYPLTTAVLAAVFANERLTKTQLLGAVLTLASVVVVSMG